MYVEKFPRGAIEILKTLNKEGYESYLVGGCIRDIVMNKVPKDWDITTNALPDVVESLFSDTIPTGKEYGTISVKMSDDIYEVTTFRLESDYDGRRPKAVKYANELIQDLKRRDFTMNALAVGLDDVLIDEFGGINDIKHGIVRCVGNSFDRLNEDRLRALRAIRFSARYGFRFTIELTGAIGQTKLDGISEERIREELNKILVSNRPSRSLKFMLKTGILEQILPELVTCDGFKQYNPHHIYDVFNHILCVLDNVEPKLELRLSALFHDIAKPQTFSIGDDGCGHFYQHHKESAKTCREIMRRLKYSNKEIEYVSELVYHHMSRYSKLRTKNVKKFINKVGEDKLDDLFKLQISDISASKPPFDFENVYKLKFMCKEVLESEEPMSVKDLDISGFDVMALGFQGEEIGFVLNSLLELVLEQPKMNEKNKLIEYIKEIT